MYKKMIHFFWAPSGCIYLPNSVDSIIDCDYYVCGHSNYIFHLIYTWLNHHYSELYKTVMEGEQHMADCITGTVDRWRGLKGPGISKTTGCFGVHHQPYLQQVLRSTEYNQVPSEHTISSRRGRTKKTDRVQNREKERRRRREGRTAHRGMCSNKEMFCPPQVDPGRRRGECSVSSSPDNGCPELGCQPVVLWWSYTQNQYTTPQEVPSFPPQWK